MYFPAANPQKPTMPIKYLKLKTKLLNVSVKTRESRGAAYVTMDEDSRCMTDKQKKV